MKPINNMKTLLRNNLIRSSGIVLFGTMAVNILNYVFNLVMGRMLSPREYGEVAALVTLIMIVAVPSATFTMLTAKIAAEHSAQNALHAVRKIWSRLSIYALGAGVTAMILLLSASGLVGEFFKIQKTPILIFALILPFTLAASVTVGTLQGLQKFIPFTVTNILGALIKLIASTIFVGLGFAVAGVMGALVLAAAASYIYALTLLKKHLPKQAHKEEQKNPPTALPAMQKIPKLSKTFKITFWTALGLALFGNIDVLLAKHYLAAAEAGEYAAIAVLGRIIVYGSLAVATAMFPAVAAAKNKTEKERKKLLKIAFSIVLAVSVPLVGIFSIFPDIVVKLLYGAAYAGAAQYLGIFSIVMALWSLSQIFIQYFLASQNRSFLAPFLIVLGGEILGIMLWHDSIEQIIQVFLASALVLLAGMTANLYIKNEKTEEVS